MNNDGYRSEGGELRPERFMVLSRGMRAGILSVELILVGLIAVMLANLVFKTLAVEPQNQPLAPTIRPAATDTDISLLRSFDPFFRDNVATEGQMQTQLPESTLNIQVFGLRARADGSGSAIVKLQDGDQKLAQVGDRLAAGVQLTAVYTDRLEIRRAGVKEAVYLRPQQERAVRKTGSTAPISQQAGARRAGIAATGFSSLELTPVRRDRRIIGFKLPAALPAPLQSAGLEGDDIITRVNGAPLSSFERLQEIGELLPAGGSLLMEIERRGQKREVTVNLEENR